jgi:hypothetical protein
MHHVLKTFAYLTSHIVQQPPRIVSWKRSSMNLVAFNVDASVLLESNLGGFGDLICDHTRFFFAWFLLRLKICSLYYVGRIYSYI